MDDLGSVQLERSDQSVITFSEATMTYWFRFRLHSEESVEGNYVLDIHMPKLDGFGFLEAYSPFQKPRIPSANTRS